MNSTPQTTARELAKRFNDEKLKAIANYGCCAFCALWIMGIEGDVGNINILADQIGYSLESDCTVHWFDFFSNVSGRKIKVEFRNIQSTTDLNGLGRCAVRFDYKGKSHWVGVENGLVVYNPLKYSECVEKGRPTTARIITLK